MSGFDWKNFESTVDAFEKKRSDEFGALDKLRKTKKLDGEACKNFSLALIDMGASSGFMMDFFDCVEENYEKVKSADKELYNNCVHAAMLAMTQFLELIANNKTLKLDGEIDIPYETLMICFKDSLAFLNDFSSSRELRPQHKLKAAAAGFTYLNTVISALNVYDDEIKKIADDPNKSPIKVLNARSTLNTQIALANVKIENSEINKQRGFKMLAEWFSDFFALFGKDIKKPDTGSYGRLFKAGEAVTTIKEPRKNAVQENAVQENNRQDIEDDAMSSGAVLRVSQTGL